MYASTLVLMIIFIFVLVPLILAEVARNKSVPTTEDFFLQSRKMPTGMVFFTVYATWMSVFAFLGSSAYFYEMGPIYMTAIAWDMLFGILFMLVGKRLWFYGKKYGYITPTDFFDDIFQSRSLNYLITIIMVTFTIPYLQIQLAGGAYLIEIATNGAIPWRICGLVFYLIIIIYLWSGGLRAVALTDVFYGLFLILSMITVGLFFIEKAGGIKTVFETIVALDEKNIILPGPKGNAGAPLWISLFIVIPIGALMGPQLWIRSYAVEKKETFNIIPLLICIASIQCFGTLLAGSAGIILEPDVKRTDTIIPVMLVQYGKPILSTLIFCGIASAALSTANSQIHAVSAIYTLDFHKRYINKNAGEKNLVQVGKWAVLIISAIAYLLLLQSSELIINTGTIAMGGTAQVFVPVIGALFWKKSNAGAAFSGVLTGVLFLIALAIFTDLNIGYCAVTALICNAVIFIVGSLTFPNDHKVRVKILEYMNTYNKECQ
ncbi:sodium:solute symporter family protein [Anaerovorax odorimutans]|uniref:sodium:solute symporter family protein n=1 Tax=Anaerovorax odorimutans TaxID=109327 RepID=UPI00041FAAF3|nr:sodium:solute symporter family protein [Anaerovorax odorimutans]